ncbi:uncharacterized protein EV422DRAFT_544456 [Fimicolochytrium jonesii]|uniref:uncharacterized protein n=1 Tax=Fimicolochytrium jonesii TaxID=1396493 RepID=UPI0022FEBBED|nr:uncharacterized protein EV422DRAFT_544456 [Fimicolochytrium jonesii]KAI8816671.1 hypothetical protein EV422DRAFT_544456 [Fimicolochytrium jonesii]
MPHGEQCICEVCTCGRHKLCKAVRTSDCHLDAHTEYGDNYLKFQSGPRTRGKAHPQQLDWKAGPFSSATESRDKFVPHAVEAHHPVPKPAYQRNDARFEDSTTSKSDYPAWAVSPAQSKKPPAVYVENPVKFSGETTSNRDYKAFDVQPRNFHKAPEYMKPTTKFEDETTNHNDYKAWKVNPRVDAHPPAKHVDTREDRDFRSTNAAAYTGGQLPRVLPAPRPGYSANPAKFEGTTTNYDSFRQWALPPKDPRQKAAYVPNPSHFEDLTTYKTNYQPKSVEVSHRQIPRYEAPDTKFEGLSTHHSDYANPGRQTRERDFRPRVGYNAIGDDRDWLTTMRSQYTPKPVDQCPAVSWIPQERERHTDGHVYLAHHDSPLAATAGEAH